uniref:Cardiolipin synthase (CMP-forming) n=1 Tax=Lynx canadensis TaxID=61383 RepID=A0A667FMW9_LYNCA
MGGPSQRRMGAGGAAGQGARPWVPATLRARLPRLPGGALVAAPGRARPEVAWDRPARPLLGRREGGPRARGWRGCRRRGPGRPLGPGERRQPGTYRGGGGGRQHWVVVAGPLGARTWTRITCPGRPKSDISDPEPGNRFPKRSYGQYENPWTIPNMLSMTRIGLAPVLGYLIIEEDFNIALGVFALAGLTDLLDGFIARNWANQKSALGSALDPLADKILISILYVSLTYADLIPVPLTYMIISRDVMLIAAVFYVRYRTLPTPRTLSKYFNPCYATARLKPTFISKVNTAVQLILVAASLAAPVFNYADSIYLQILWCFTAFTTAASAYSYYHYGRKTVQVIKGR